MSTKTTRKPAAKKAAPKVTAIPKGARVPQDHKAKAEEPPEFLTATVGGIEWQVPRDAIDDFELLDDLNALDQRDDPTRMPSVLRRPLGNQWSKAMEHLRDKETGRVSLEAGSQFVFDLMEALDPNSSGS